MCDRRARDKRARQIRARSPALTWTDRFDDLLASDIDIIVEAIPGSEPAVDYVRAALLAGKSVVTANKQVIAHQGPALLSLAERQGRQLRFEAAVGRRHADRARAGRRHGRRPRHAHRRDPERHEQRGAVEGWRRPAARWTRRSPRRARSGYADVDPSVDLDGVDAAAKLAILCALAFRLRVAPSAIETRTTARIGADRLREAARQRGGTIRQIAHALFDRSSGRLDRLGGAEFRAARRRSSRPATARRTPPSSRARTPATSC